MATQIECAGEGAFDDRQPVAEILGDTLQQEIRWRGRCACCGYPSSARTIALQG